MDANGLAERLAHWFKEVTSSRKRCAVIACVFTLVVFTIANAAWMPKDFDDYNDDWTIALALSGKWGPPQGICLYLNVLLCRVIFFLNTVIPQFNWFYIVEGACTCAALFTLLYLALSRLDALSTCLTAAAFVLLCLPGCTYFSNFTYVGCICCCAGGAALMSSLHEDRHRATLVCSGVLFMALGLSWRWQMLLLSIPFFGIAALVCTLVDQRPQLGVARALLRLWPFAAALVFCGACHLYSMGVMAQSPWAEWRQVAVETSALTDYPVRPYGEIADDLREIGVSENDYRLITNWVSGDPEFFTVERIAAIADIASMEAPGLDAISSTLESYVDDLKHLYERLVLVVALAFIAVLLCRRWGWRNATALGLLVLGLGVSLYFQFIGRLPDRVHLSICLYAITALCFLFTQSKKAKLSVGREAHAPTGAVRGLLGVGVCGLSLVAALVSVGVLVPHISKGRVEPVFAINSFEPSCSLAAYVNEHPDNSFVFGVSTNADLKLEGEMRGMLPESILARYVHIAGWDSRAPFVVASDERQGMANPLRGLVENPQALYIGAPKDPPDDIVLYLREHYAPEASYELVDVIAGSKNFGALNVYRFTLG